MAILNQLIKSKRLSQTLAIAVVLLVPLHSYATCQGMVLHAHRGHPDAPENSKSAITRALSGSWDGVEIDIQQLHDSQWVLHHDLQLGRTTTLGGRRVHDLTISAWNEVLLKDRKGRVTSERAPFLSDVLESFSNDGGNKVLNVELKQSGSSCSAAQQAFATLQRGLLGGNWFLTAIDRTLLRCVRQVDPRGYLGQIVIDPKSLGSQNAVTRTTASRLPSPLVDKAWLRRLQQEVGKPVGVHIDIFTLNANPQLLVTARNLGVPVFTYHVGSDTDHALALRQARRITGLLPTGAVINGHPEVFCTGVSAT